MKAILTLGAVALVFLIGCGPDEKAATPPAEDAAAIDAAVEDTQATATETDLADDQQRPQAVEESGGEPEADEGDKPIILAQADSAPAREWKFKEGQHFQRMVPTQPTLGGADKIEVAEVFWYGCGHCFEFESYIDRWTESMPANTRFVRIPATWNTLVKLHAQLYYTEEALVKTGKIADAAGFRAGVFNEYHRRNNRMTSMAAIKDVFARSGVSEADFDSAWNSFEVAQKLRVAQDLAKRYAISGVPAMVVNGKFRAGKAETGTYPRLLELVDELIERETVR